MDAYLEPVVEEAWKLATAGGGVRAGMRASGQACVRGQQRPR